MPTKVHYRGTGQPEGTKVWARPKGVWRLGAMLLDSDVTACGLLCTTPGLRARRNNTGKQVPDSATTLLVTRDAAKVTCGNCLRNRDIAEVHSEWPDVGLRSQSFKLRGAPGDTKRGMLVEFKPMNNAELLVVMDVLMHECGSWLKGPDAPLLPLPEGQRRNKR